LLISCLCWIRKTAAGIEAKKRRRAMAERIILTRDFPPERGETICGGGASWEFGGGVMLVDEGGGSIGILVEIESPETAMDGGLIATSGFGFSGNVEAFAGSVGLMDGLETKSSFMGQDFTNN
jgi:hypothetical protein